MIIFFLIILITLIYIYLGYPLLVFLLSKIIRKRVAKKEIYPLVSIIIAAYNEEKIIEKKILNTLAIDYPKDKLEIIVFSDASSDNTDNIVKKYAKQGIKLLRYEGRRGKTYCQNESVKKAKGEIIVFSDANSMYDKFAVKNLVFNFSDTKVGVVCGELKYLKNNKSEEGFYWKIERFLKQRESLINSCLGANGSIYALRKNLYVDLPLSTISDFIAPFYIFKQNYRVVYDKRAFCFEETGDNKNEFNRKRRIILRSLNSLKYIKEFLNPFKYGFYSLQLWSHKILRWLIPFFLIILLISNLFLLNILFFEILLYSQLLFYFIAMIGSRIRNKLFSIPYYFCLINLSSMLAFIDFLKGKTKITWNVNR
jgi:cellulose synthase/poly-beta-1,6-N-acetylglucosamine synthase-like glycosyltransferase